MLQTLLGCCGTEQLVLLLLLGSWEMGPVAVSVRHVALGGVCLHQRNGLLNLCFKMKVHDLSYKLSMNMALSKERTFMRCQSELAVS